MRLFIYIVVCVCMFTSYVNTCFAQKKKTAPQTDLAERTPYKDATSKKDTVEVIYQRVPAKAPKQAEVVTPLYKVKETVITKPSSKDSFFKKNLPIVYDTVKFRRKPKNEDEVAETKPMPAPINNTAVADKKPGAVKPVDTEPVVKEGVCKCVNIAIAAQDTIRFEDYVNYSFVFRNDCKAEVFVHSGSFRFVVADYFGKPVKRIRKLDFIKRFDHPEFVRLSPGETYEYRFADDPFFEYELSRGMQYRFTFIYNNQANKYRAAPAKTFHCAESKEHVITVK
ncbi:MAG: hypothetical protein JNK00_04880 [Flavipsychrobacter sp.]|nr:hypothetical protein [Flavipsychrobacter sp.]